MKKFLYITGIVLTTIAGAQQPFINSLDKFSGTANEVVTISGTGFSTSPTVYFGKGKVTSFVSTPTDELILAYVPATATYGSVTVVNGTSDLSATSSQLFSLSFDNDFAGETFTIPTPATAISTTQGFSYDLCLCDFNSDDLLDAVVTNNEGTSLSIFTNGSTPGVPSFSLTSHPTENTNTTHNVECKDLNSDGKPDLVVSSNSSGEPFVHIYQNTSAGAISFTRIERIVLDPFDSNTRQPKRVRIADIDGDGLEDIIIGNVLVGDNNVIVLLNQSSGAVEFSTFPHTIDVPNASHTGAVYPGDFDNDGKIDLAILPSRQDSESIYLLKNTSIPGSVTFTSQGTVGGSAERVNLVVGDFNFDGLNDIAASKRTGATDGGSLEIFQNDGNFIFISGGETNSSSISPWGIDAGDMNGDGKADIVMGSTSDDIVYLENTTVSSGGNISFSSIVVESTGDPVRNVRIGDLNKDGKPDIAFTNNSISGSNGEFQYIINDGCMTPVISPSSGTYCNGGDYILTATAGEGVTYAWNVSGDTPVSPSSTTNTLNLNDEGYDANISVTVTATSPDGLCTINAPSTSNFLEGGGAPVATPILDDPGLVCLGTELKLTSSTLGQTNYVWSGPNGFSTSTGTTSEVVVTASASAIHSGSYTLSVDNGTCPSPNTTFDVTISGPPVTSVEVTDCDDGSLTLEVPDLSSQFTYQWVQDGSTNLGTSATQTVTSAGIYTLEISDLNGPPCVYTTGPIIIPVGPTSSYSNPDFGGGATNEICLNVAADFTATSTTGDGSLTMGYTWEVEDPLATITTSSGSALNFTFTSVGAWKVRLITNYTDGFGCDMIEKDITVSADPAFTITLDDLLPINSSIQKCSSDSVNLTLNGANTSNGDIWTWDDGDATTDLSAFDNLVLKAAAGTITSTYTSGSGCQTTTSSVIVTDFPGIDVTATESNFEGTGTATTTAKNDTIIFMEDQKFVTLSANNSLGYSWAALTSSAIDVTNSNIDDPTAATVVVTPSSPTTTVTVSGQTPDGCIESTNIVINSGNFTPRSSFSPNGDGLNDWWTINNSRNMDGCTVHIFDSRGAVILQTTSPFTDDQVWDGNYKGKSVPEGVYYFTLKCDDSANNQSGAILLAR